jgi:hypothetical protein
MPVKVYKPGKPIEEVLLFVGRGLGSRLQLIFAAQQMAHPPRIFIILGGVQSSGVLAGRYFGIETW